MLSPLLLPCFCCTKHPGPITISIVLVWSFTFLILITTAHFEAKIAAQELFGDVRFGFLEQNTGPDSEVELVEQVVIMVSELDGLVGGV